MKQRIKIIIIVIVMCVITLVLGLGLGLGLKQHSSSILETSSSSIETSPSPNSLNDIEIVGSMSVLYDKINVNSTAPSTAPLNFLRSLISKAEQLPITFDTCFPGPENIVSISPEMIQLVAGILGVDSSCVISSSSSSSSPKLCKGSGTTLMADTNYIGFVYPQSSNTRISNDQVKQIIMGLNGLTGSKDYVIMFATNYMKNSPVGIGGVIYIIDSSKSMTDMTRDIRTDDDSNKYNIVFAGYPVAISNYKNVCKNIPMHTFPSI